MNYSFKLLVLIVLFLLLIFNISTAQWISTKVTDNNKSDDNPSLAVDVSGVIHIVYRGVHKYKKNDWNYKLFYTTKNPEGEFTSPVRITDTPKGVDEKYPGIVIDNQGVHIIFGSTINGDVLQKDIYHATIDVNGNVSEPDAVTNTSVRDERAAMTVNSDGTVHISYTEPDEGKRFAGDYEIWYANSTTAPPGGIMHIAGVTVDPKVKGNKVNGVVTVMIKDEFDNSVEGANILGIWSGLTSDHDNFPTSADGSGNASSDKVDKNNNQGYFTFTIQGVSKSV